MTNYNWVVYFARFIYHTTFAVLIFCHYSSPYLELTSKSQHFTAPLLPSSSWPLRTQCRKYLESFLLYCSKYFFVNAYSICFVDLLLFPWLVSHCTVSLSIHGYQIQSPLLHYWNSLNLSLMHWLSRQRSFQTCWCNIWQCFLRTPLLCMQVVLFAIMELSFVAQINPYCSYVTLALPGSLRTFEK